jgi:dephospho-CoA kinase
MLKIGLTGNIGSGKTTVAKVFELLGIPVFYADDEAKNVMVTDTILVEEIKQSFGPESYFEDGSLNRKHIAGIVFNNSTQLQKLNALVHPAVFRAFDNLEAKAEGAPYIIREAAILFESGSYKTCQRTIVVTAPLDLRIARVMQRDEEKKNMADDIIINDDHQLVIPQVLALHNKYLALAKSLNLVH